MKIKSFSFLMLCLVLAVPALAQTSETATGSVSREVVRNGISLGSVLAVVLSWHRNRSILLAIVCSLFSWLYVIYYAFTKPAGE